MSEKNKSKSSSKPSEAKVSAQSKGPTAPKLPEDYKVQRGTARALRRQGLVQGWRNITGAKQMLPPSSATVS